ncbi:sensor histidine kinase [Alkalicaulis satelles]|uniref:histidine kinase n=2 Tax=Alkalicaulis satelles TaxID=2609175 RepID=A0A5M6ZPM4_9PROT|nr:sensor histidine kinase [Alkalicaulis satelles]
MVRRLVLAALVWALVLLVVGAAALTFLFQSTVLRDLDDRLTGVVDSLIAHVELDESGFLELDQRPVDPGYFQALSGRYWQVFHAGAEPGEPILRSDSLANERLDTAGPMVRIALDQPGLQVVGETRGPNLEPMRVHVRAVLIEGEGPVVLAAAEDRRPSDRRVRDFALAASALLAAFAAALAFGVVVLVRLGLAPVLRIRDAVAEVRDGKAEWVSGAFPREIRPLAEELNALLDHSREVVDRARTHVGNLAHALKTPLTVLGNEARSQSGPLAELVERQTRAMTDQVEHHLRRARAAANARSIGARTSADIVISDLGRTLRRIYARRGVEIDWEAPAGLTFRGERQDLEDLAGNLMDNACKWARGQVRVTAAPGAPGRLEIAVEDDGPGLSEAQRQQALARGVRLDEQAPGTGLGLAIVSDLARAYGGELTLDASELGGLRARLDLPGGTPA